MRGENATMECGVQHYRLSLLAGLWEGEARGSTDNGKGWLQTEWTYSILGTGIGKLADCSEIRSFVKLSSATEFVVLTCCVDSCVDK